MLSWVVICRSTLRRTCKPYTYRVLARSLRAAFPFSDRFPLTVSPKSFPFNSFADPHSLTQVPSILYKNGAGRGSRSNVVIKAPLSLWSGDPDHVGTRQPPDLSPLECAVADKHRVLPIFSRCSRPSSPLEATLRSTLVGVDSKRLTWKAKFFRCNTYKNQGGSAMVLPGRTSIPVRCPDLSPLFATLTKNCRVGTQNFHSGRGCTPNVQPSNDPRVPLQPSAFGATITKGTAFRHDSGKQLRSPRCLRLMSGHREQLNLGSLYKSCLGPAF
jgi:hypothetical protein